MLIDAEFLDAITNLDFPENHLFADHDRLEIIIEKLVFILKMQIQPEYIWENHDMDRLHILKTTIATRILQKIGDRKNFANQQIGHPLLPIFLRGLEILDQYPEYLIIDT